MSAVSGGAQVIEDPVENPGAGMTRCQHPLHVLHYEDRGRELPDDAQVLPIQEMAFVGLEFLGVVATHPCPACKRIGLAGGAADEHPVPGAGQSFTDPCIDFGVIVLAKFGASGLGVCLVDMRLYGRIIFELFAGDFTADVLIVGLGHFTRRKGAEQRPQGQRPVGNGIFFDRNPDIELTGFTSYQGSKTFTKPTRACEKINNGYAALFFH